ncbi:helix-turn-helix transcriptional regulator [Ahrensia sp. 13_GOM-1096m]|uniref:helix-turn-helix transcriptional regulator n=1 Tax=Ahrensia TaxID=152180 RepID=UPI000362BC04
MSTVLAYSIDEGARALGISRSLFYQLVKYGEIKIVKIGRRSVVRSQELERYLNSLEVGGN